MNDLRLTVSGAPSTLAELEAICATAREQGFDDAAWVSFSEHRNVSVRTSPDDLRFAPADRAEAAS